MQHKKIYLSQFTHYLAAKTENDADAAVAEIREQNATEYQHWRDHWKPMKDALVRDRRGSRDGQELADTAAGATARRKPSYTRAAERWAQLVPEWDGLEPERLRNKAVRVGDLNVVVPWLCAERHDDGELEALHVRFNQDKLPPHVALGAMRIVQLAHPDATITVVDVDQLAVYRSQGRDLTVYDEWLTEAGNDLGKQLGDGQDQADVA